MVAVVLLEREELAVGGCAESHALLGAGAMADIREHHLAGKSELDWPIQLSRGSGGDSRVWPWEELAAESGTDVAGDDFDVLLGLAQYLRENGLMVHNTLRRLVESVFLAVPYGDGGVHFHRIMRFHWSDVGLVDLNGGSGEDTFGVAAMAQDARVHRVGLRVEGYRRARWPR